MERGYICVKCEKRFSRSECKEMKITKARVWHENCKRCYKPILPGEYYIHVDGSLTRKCGIAHLACDFPSHPLLKDVIAREDMEIKEG